MEWLKREAASLSRGLVASFVFVAVAAGAIGFWAFANDLPGSIIAVAVLASIASLAVSFDFFRRFLAERAKPKTMEGWAKRIRDWLDEGRYKVLSEPNDKTTFRFIADDPFLQFRYTIEQPISVPNFVVVSGGVHLNPEHEKLLLTTSEAQYELEAEIMLAVAPLSDNMNLEMKRPANETLKISFLAFFHLDTSTTMLQFLSVIHRVRISSTLADMICTRAAYAAKRKSGNHTSTKSKKPRR